MAKSASWVSVIGVISEKNGVVKFQGGRVASALQSETSSNGEPMFGLALSSHRISDGTIGATVTFDDVNPESICSISISYDPNARHVVTAGFGGESDSLFSIREFGGPKNNAQPRWWYYRTGGSKSSLKAGVPHSMEVALRGTSLTLSIDGVAVGVAEVSAPGGAPRTVGLTFRGDFGITVKDFVVSAAKPRAFVVMQFGGHYDELYRDVVKEVCKDYEVSLTRADEIMGPGMIMSDIVRELSTASLVIADITPTNPNVYFEVGYAIALNKPTILLAEKGTKLPFDVSGLRVLFYENSIGGKGKLEAGLRSHLDAILAS